VDGRGTSSRVDEDNLCAFAAVKPKVIGCGPLLKMVELGGARLDAAGWNIVCILGQLVGGQLSDRQQLFIKDT